MLSVAVNPRHLQINELKSRRVRARQARTELAASVSPDEWVQPYSVDRKPLEPVDQTSHLVDRRLNAVDAAKTARDHFEETFGANLSQLVVKELSEELAAYEFLDMKTHQLRYLVQRPMHSVYLKLSWYQAELEKTDLQTLELPNTPEPVTELIQIRKKMLKRLADLTSLAAGFGHSEDKTRIAINRDTQLRQWALQTKEARFDVAWQRMIYLRELQTDWLTVEQSSHEISIIDKKLSTAETIWKSIFERPEAAQLAADLNVDLISFGASQAVADIDAIADGEEIRLALQPIGVNTPDFGSL